MDREQRKWLKKKKKRSLPIKQCEAGDEIGAVRYIFAAVAACLQDGN